MTAVGGERTAGGEGSCADAGTQRAAVVVLTAGEGRRVSACRTTCSDASGSTPSHVARTSADVLAKARKVLGWKHKTSFRDMIKEMVASDLAVVKAEAMRFGRHD